MGTKGTAGFLRYRVNYGKVMGIFAMGHKGTGAVWENPNEGYPWRTLNTTSLSLSEETMQLQLMCCAHPNPLSSQFWMGIGLDRR